MEWNAKTCTEDERQDRRKQGRTLGDETLAGGFLINRDGADATVNFLVSQESCCRENRCFKGHGRGPRVRSEGLMSRVANSGRWRRGRCSNLA